MCTKITKYINKLYGYVNGRFKFDLTINIDK